MTFRRLTKEAEKDFQKFRWSNSFADKTFSMLYAWNEEFDYRYGKLGDSIGVFGTEKNGTITSMLINPEEKEAESLAKTIHLLKEETKADTEILTIKYAEKGELLYYQEAARILGSSIRIETDEAFSDYIYETEKFLEMQGGCNRKKRNDYNVLNRCFPNLRVVNYEKKRYDDLCLIFEKWCGRHSCRDCFYGCEKKSFFRFLEIYDKRNCKIMMAYDGETPLSFAASERINRDTVCYYYQKNAFSQRGLTYWLNRKMLLTEKNIRYVNLCEDMGISGLRMEKSNLHPCKKQEKYTIIMGESK